MTVGTTLGPALVGFLTGLGLIVAIGAQNAYLLRLGISAGTRVVLPVVLVCALSDAALMIAGVLGIGALLEAYPDALVVVRVLGVAFLVVYGVLAAARAIRPRHGGLDADGGMPVPGVRTAVLTATAFTWLNPHVYLDTLVLVGSIANQQPSGERPWWVGGAISSSVLWFFALGFGARLLRPVFARPRAWRVLDALIAVVMFAIAARLALVD